MESAPFDEVNQTIGEFDVRPRETMDLSGGDYEIMYDTLQRFKQVFAFVGRRTPTPQVEKQTIPVRPEEPV